MTEEKNVTCEPDEEALGRKKIGESIRLVFFLIAGGFGITYFACPHCIKSVYNYTMVGIFSSLIWIVLWFGNAWVANLVSRYVSWMESPVKRFFLGIVSTIVYTVLAMYLLTVTFNWVANFDIEFTTETVYFPIVITFVISAFMHGKTFLKNWRMAALEAESSKKESAMARYEALKNQINPHFLFNSLNALTNLVYEDQDKAAQFIKQLSEVYRYVLDSREKELVPMADELHFVQSYLYLQQIRFGENLKVKIDLQHVKGCVAPLALQLLLENAIKHNIVSVDDPLFINVFEENGFICVENNLQKKNQPLETSVGLGLDNIRNRYRFLTDREVEIMETKEKFLVKIPLIPEEL
jgi:sensor histidine kinase YesM